MKKGEQFYEKDIQADRSGLRKLRSKMENNIRKIDGVADATVSFMAQKMTVEADDDRFESIMDEVVKVCRKVEPDCEIVR